MIKHIREELSVVFEEIPDEITLAFNISNCQNNCPGCHSPHLHNNIGEELVEDNFIQYIKQNNGITCICFMGEGNDIDALLSLVSIARINFPELKIGLYSGRKELSEELMNNFDYVKIGPYNEFFGPLNKKTTNQHLFKHMQQGWEDITYKFWN